MPLKKKYTGSKADVERGYMYGYTKQFPRSHSGNGKRKDQKGPGGSGEKSVNNTYLFVDGGTGRARMRRR